MVRFIRSLLAVLCVIMCLPVSGMAQGSCLTLPAELKRIEAEAFSHDQGITEVILPEGLTYIGSKAFDGSTLLEMTIPRSVTQIEEDAFEGISPNAVISVYPDSPASLYFAEKATPFSVRVIQNEVTPWKKLEHSFEFDANDGLIVQVYGALDDVSHLVFDENYYGMSISKLVIERDAFSGNTQLKSVSFSNVPTSIGASAFNECSGLTGSLTIPSSVEKIGEGAFYGCHFDGELSIQPGVKEIGMCAFSENNFTGSLTIPDTVQEMGGNAFCRAGFTGSLVIPGSLESISEGTFVGCGFQGSLFLGEGLKRIGFTAFSVAVGFSGGLRIPNSVRTIDDSAFIHAGFDGRLILGNAVESIGARAFEQCGFTGSLIIPDSVRDIGNGAFQGCHDFDGTLTLGHNVTRIGSGAFAECNQFTGSLTLPDSVTTLGAGAFQSCSGLNGTLTLSQNLKEWEWEPKYNSNMYLFSNCTGLKKVIILSGMTEIPEGMFSECTGLESVVIGSDITSIGERAFADCTNLRGILDLRNVTSIGARAFENCASLMGARLPNDVDGSLSGFVNMNKEFTVYCDVNSNTAAMADQCGLRWSHMAMNLVDGLPSGQLPMGEAAEIHGALQCNTIISKLRATILDKQTNEIVRQVQLDVNALAVGFYRLTKLLTIEDLPIGQYGFTLEMLLDGEEAYWTVSSTAFEIVYAPVKYWRSSDFVVPSGLHAQGQAYEARGSVKANRNIESVDIAILDGEGNSVQTVKVTPNDKLVSMGEAFHNVHFEKLGVGLYTFEMSLTLEGTTRRIARNQFRVYNYDGYMDQKTAQTIIAFCMKDPNRLIFSKYNDYADYLKKIDNWHAAAMVVSKYSDIVRDQFIALLKERNCDEFVVKLYKDAIFEMMSSLDPDAAMPDVEIETSFEKYASGLLKDISKEGTIATDIVLQAYDGYEDYLRSMIEGISDNKAKQIKKAVFWDEIEYCENVKKNMKMLGKVTKVQGYTKEAVEIYFKMTADYQRSIHALASLASAYGDSPSDEFLVALQETIESYQNSACIAVTEAFEIISEELVEKGMGEVTKGILGTVGANLTYSIATFLLKEGVEIFGINEMAESDYEFLTLTNLMIESRQAFSRAFDAVQGGDTSSDRLNQVYYSFEATQYSLGKIYDFLIEKERDNAEVEMNLINLRNEVLQLKLK